MAESFKHFPSEIKHCFILILIFARSCPWYDKCGLFGTKCGKSYGSDYINDGCTCRRPPKVVAKKSYGRGVGKPMKCIALLGIMLHTMSNLYGVIFSVIQIWHSYPSYLFRVFNQR